MGQCLNYILGTRDDKKLKKSGLNSSAKQTKRQNNPYQDSHQYFKQQVNTDMDEEPPAGVMDSKVSPKSIYVTNEKLFREVMDPVELEKELNQRKKINLDSFTIVKVKKENSKGKAKTKE